MKKTLFVSITALILSVIALAVVVLPAKNGGSLGSTEAPMEAFTAFYTTTVGTSATAVLTADSGRSYALFTNDSDTAIYLNFSTASTTVANYAVRLNATGGTYEMSAANNNLYLGQVWASSTASKVMRTLVK